MGLLSRSIILLIHKCFINVIIQISYIFFSHVYLFLRQRETERESGRGREREGDTESEAGSRLRAVSTELDAGLELTNREIMT